MLAEWIRILGLDEEQPPWEGEPREIRATLNGKEEGQVAIIKIDKKNGIAYIIPLEDYTDGHLNIAHRAKYIQQVDIRELQQITIVY